ncbi:MAG: hypothetical protein HYU64_18490 [Armatimonadetes bacterium]|nr:hypothetical protein [Armatimonadota bacterium]
MDVVITANSPGELWGWVRPVVGAVRDRFPESRIFVFMLPCPYASGKEAQVARTLPQIQGAFTPGQYFLYALFGIRPKGFDPSKNCVIIHIGGDVMHSSFLAMRLRAPAFAYMWGNRLWDRFFRRYFVMNECGVETLLRQHIQKDKILVVGNLLTDAVLDALEKERNGRIEPPEDDPLSVCLLPGSRPYEVRYGVPFFLQVADHMGKHLPDLEFSMVVSPFVSLDQLRDALSRPPDPCIDAARGTLVQNQAGWELRSESGTRVSLVLETPYQAMKESDLIITIPGTKCGEAGCLGRPMLVLLPLNKPEEIPFIGIVGLLNWIPFVGRPLKRYLVRQIAKRFGYVAQPNIYAQAPIVPELKGNLSAEDVANEALLLLSDKDVRTRMENRLAELFLPSRGASSRLVEILAEEISCCSKPS